MVLAIGDGAVVLKPFKAGVSGRPGMRYRPAKEGAREGGTGRLEGEKVNERISTFFCSVLQRQHQFHNLLHLDFIVDIPSLQKRQAFIYRII